MELVLNKNSQEKVVNYDVDKILIKTSNFSNVMNLLEDKTYIYKQMIKMIENDMSLDEKTKEILGVEHEHDIALIKTLEKYGDEKITIDDFDKIIVVTFDVDDLIEEKDFLESLNKDILIDLRTEDIPLEKLKQIQKFKLKSKPNILHEYNNNNPVSLNDFVLSMEILANLKDKVKKYKLSPLEQLMLLYDILKDRVYRENIKNPNSTRELTGALKNKSIVCLGFANIFKAVATALGISTEIKNYGKYENGSKTSRGHANNVCYINDPTYNFNGCLEFDVTWDSKIHKNDRNINKYIWYGQSIENSEKAKKAENYLPNASTTNIGLIDINYRTIDPDDYFMKLEFVTSLKEFYLKINDQSKVNLVTFYQQKLINNERIDDEELVKLKKDFDEYKSAFLSSSAFAKIFYNVRRIEHLMDPLKYPLDKEIFFNVLKSRYKPDKEMRLYASIFGSDALDELRIKERLTSDYFEKIPEKKYSEKLKNDVKRMELLHNLKQVLEQEQQQDTVKNKKV